MKTNFKKITGLIFAVLLCFMAVFIALTTSACGNENSVERIYYVGGSSADSDSNGTVSGLVIPLSEFSSTAKFYGVEIDGTYMEIIAVKASGSYRTAFNTCQVCYTSENGYFKQSGNYLVCQNCGNRYSMSQVGVAVYGNCNPYPILESNRVQTSDSIIIPDTFLRSCKKIFANWTGGY